jgi:hypothetical protein
VERRQASASRWTRAAPRWVRRLDYASVGVPPPFFVFLFVVVSDPVRQFRFFDRRSNLKVRSGLQRSTKLGRLYVARTLQLSAPTIVGEGDRAQRGGRGACLNASLSLQGNERRRRYFLESVASRRVPRPFHHPSGGPPSPLSRGRMKEVSVAMRHAKPQSHGAKQAPRQARQRFRPAGKKLCTETWPSAPSTSS